MSSWHGRIVSKLSSRTLVQKSYGHRHFSLRTIPNVVRTQDGAHIPDAVLPFNFDFVDDRLRKALIRRKVDVDEVERLYNSQVRNDYEFNSPALPQQDSPLWGYVYGEHLVRSKVRLETLSKEEEFLRKYLQSTVDELTVRMKRYYPQLDWQSRFEYEIAQVKLPINEGMEDCYADATAELISRSPTAYISFHKNNAFIQKYDDNDEFKDHLPQQLEKKLITYYEFLWDHSSSKVDKSKYFGKMKAIDKALSPLEALSSQFRKNWDGFIEESFAQSDIATVSSVVSIVQDATSVVEVKTEKTAKELVDEIWTILDFGSRSLDATQATLCGNLFFGKCCTDNLVDKDSHAVKNILVNTDLERLKVLRQAVEIKEYLKNHSISRLLLGVLIHQFPVKFAPLFTQESALQSFVTQNQTPFEKYASQLKTLYDVQENFAEALQQLKDSIRETTGLKCCAISNCFSTLKGHVKLTDQCPLVISLEGAAKRAQEKGDIHAELKLRSTVKYLKTVKNVPWYKLFRTINAPRRGEWCGDGLEAVSTYAATNGNEAFETLFKSIVEALKSHALLSSDVNTIKSSLAKQWDQVQKSAVKVNEARVNANNALYQIQFHYDDLNFNRIRENYNPLDIYLSNYNYL